MIRLNAGSFLSSAARAFMATVLLASAWMACQEGIPGNNSMPTDSSKIKGVASVGNQEADSVWRNKLIGGLRDSLGVSGNLELLPLQRLNDSIDFCICNWSDRICARPYVVVLKYLKEVGLAQIAENCDADLSIPEYSYSEYFLDSSAHSIRTYQYTEKADSSYCRKNGSSLEFREGYNMDNAQTTTDTTAVELFIESTGSFQFKKLSHL